MQMSNTARLMQTFILDKIEEISKGIHNRTVKFPYDKLVKTLDIAHIPFEELQEFLQDIQGEMFDVGDGSVWVITYTTSQEKNCHGYHIEAIKAMRMILADDERVKKIEATTLQRIRENGIGIYDLAEIADSINLILTTRRMYHTIQLLTTSVQIIGFIIVKVDPDTESITVNVL